MSSDRFNKNQTRWWTSLVWPVAGLALLLLFNFFFTEGFFKLEVRDGHLYGGSWVRFAFNRSWRR